MARSLSTRLAIAAALLVVAVFAGRQSLAFALADRQPQLALRIDADQPVALANAARLAIAGSPSPASLAQARDQAARALTKDPMSSQAAAAIGAFEQLHGAQDKAARAMLYAERLSRRDLSAQLWWIEFWALRGSVDRTLRHYDLAMRTARDAPAVLFPVLQRAVSNPIVARRLVPLLANRPAWSEQFLQQLAQSGSDEDAIYRLFLLLPDTTSDVPTSAVNVALNRLARNGRMQEAYRLFASYHPSDAGQPVRNARFTPIAREATPFDWRMVEDGGSAELTPEGLLVEGSDDGRGSAQQIVALSPGPHAVIIESAPETAGPRLTVECVADGEVIGRAVGAGRATIRLDFAVPQGCKFQRLRIAIGTPSSSDRTAVVRAIRILN
jgi:hypothetical protein